MNNCDFSGYATRNDLACGDGRVIRKNAFSDNDGCTVPLVWNHNHTNPEAVIGHALLENRADGVYAYGTFNDTEEGKRAKMLVQHGDVRSLSIWAKILKQVGSDVIHGDIKELSLVLAGANPGAYVDFVMAHGVDEEDELFASYDENIMLHHSAEQDEKKETNSQQKEENKDESKKEKTIGEVVDTMTEEQKNALYAALALARGSVGDDNEEDNKEDNKDMKHSIFDQGNTQQQTNVLSHSDEVDIINMAKKSSVGSLKQAMTIFAEEHSDELAHGVFDAEVEKLFPEYELLKKGEPETLERDQSWIDAVISKVHKSPFSRIRTRHADARIAELKANGYQKKGDYKENMEKIKLIGRSTDPQTIYIKDELNRDDIVDITDFKIVDYQWKVMRHVLNEVIAMAILVGDGREEGDADKIHEDHIRSIWNDDELYCIHADVDVAAAKTKLQGTNTGANFSENYILAEAMIEAALYSREKFKGTGTPDLYCTPHLLNVMLLSRDLNGRRIYDSKSDLAKALNVNEIHTVEQFEGLQRTTSTGEKKNLLGLFVNLSDYQLGATNGGEITKFEDFDIDFNRYKYLLETRLSGSLTKLYSAIALEEPAA